MLKKAFEWNVIKRGKAYYKIQGVPDPTRLVDLLVAARKSLGTSNIHAARDILDEAFKLILGFFLDTRDEYKGLVKEFFKLSIKVYIEYAELCVLSKDYSIADNYFEFAEAFVNDGGLELPEKYHKLKDLVDSKKMSASSQRILLNPGETTTQ